MAAPPPTAYNPAAPSESAPPLPSAPSSVLGPSSVLQPPLSRRGSGPGLVLILPSPGTIPPLGPDAEKPLDPEPLLKWAEEGFAVVAITLPEPEMELTGDDASASDVVNLIRDAVDALQKHESVDTKDKFALVIYEEAVISSLLLDADRLQQYGIAGIVTFSHAAPEITTAIPLLAHTSTPSNNSNNAQKPNVTVHCYPETTPHFVFPSAAAYNNAAATMSHTRSLVFLRKHLGGPDFDLEAIWEEHCYWEFEARSVAQTMATMVAEPYVNHIPTMTGGIGREKLTAFYHTHLKTVSRTIGPDRIIDEFIFCCTHTRQIPFLVPGVPVTNKPLAIPMVGVINIRGDRLYHEHIWWDQGTVLRQLGILPTHLPYEGGLVKLPVAGDETARLLLDERDGTSNEMIEGAVVTVHESKDEKESGK
ncbi:hypothetical protein THARTR1_09660 [Trichoderma harzianum]|uniref:Carboxymethylenebutenolidase n=1 Tax=Trichoderma harzianum TaxID=5544 RepID=A0A2K0TVT7_TRIHA|nr:hypothetical protein THARTR1_09660 [Trichoderma harzianum]